MDDCLEESKLRLSDLDGIAVTTTPGLVIALRVGVSTALSLARYYVIICCQLLEVEECFFAAEVTEKLCPSQNFC